jgi:hypothetical protein
MPPLLSLFLGRAGAVTVPSGVGSTAPGSAIWADAGAGKTRAQKYTTAPAACEATVQDGRILICNQPLFIRRRQRAPYLGARTITI